MSVNETMTSAANALQAARAADLQAKLLLLDISVRRLRESMKSPHDIDDGRDAATVLYAGLSDLIDGLREAVDGLLKDIKPRLDPVQSFGIRCLDHSVSFISDGIGRCADCGSDGGLFAAARFSLDCARRAFGLAEESSDPVGEPDRAVRCTESLCSGLQSGPDVRSNKHLVSSPNCESADCHSRMSTTLGGAARNS